MKKPSSLMNTGAFLFAAIWAAWLVVCWADPTEKDALQDFYVALDGDNWPWPEQNGNDTNTKWDFDTDFPHDPCDDGWYGVECECDANDECHVVALLLYNMSLSGQIPDTIEYLPYLVELDLEHNSITGSLPATISNLVNMEVFNVAKNFLVGSVPSDIGRMHKTQVFDIGYNYRMTGTFPASITNMTQLRNLVFQRNHHIRGTLPEDIGNLVELEQIYIAHTKMTGSLPASITKLTKLRQLRLQLCHFSGTLPPDLGDLQSLVLMNFFHNDFTGELPTSLTRIPNLRHFLVHDNHLHGSIPHDLGNMSALTNFACARNYLQGTIPPGVGQLAHLRSFYVRGNPFTGTLPDTIGPGNLALYYFNTEQTFIHGTIPHSLMQLPAIQHLRLFHAMLTGTIPDNIGDLQKLVVVFLGTNQLHGTLPASIMTIPTIQRIGVDFNQLTGTIPAGVSDAVTLNHVYFDGNLFSGPLPDMTRLHRLVELFVHENHFSGSFPVLLAPDMRILTCNQNHFSGLLPPLFTRFPNLTVALVQNNYFTGPLIREEDHFRPEGLKLATLDFSENRLTGSLHDGLFDIPTIESFALADNCILSSVPESACKAESLKILVLNGMHAECGNLLWYHKVYSTLPACLLNMTELHTLQVAGNGITGTLPDDPISPSLMNLVLAHNELRGKIPDTMQTRHWVNLELSYNKFSSSLNPHFMYDNHTHLALSVNRLSGPVPDSFQTAEHISVLKGNIYSCPYEGGTLPHHDSERPIYTCGTNPLNIVLAVFGGLFLAFTAGLYVQQRQDPDTVPKAHAAITWHVISDLKSTFLKVTVFICLVLGPLYIAFSAFYKNYAYSYAWILSGVYLNGAVPAVTLGILWFGLLFYFLIKCEHFVFASIRESVSDKVRSDRAKIAWKKQFYLILLVVFNIALSVIFNGLFVYLQLNHGAVVNAFTQIALATFKISWNRFVLPLLMYNKRVFNNSLYENLNSRREEIEKLERKQVLTEALLNVFNNIIAPLIATMVVDVSCFYNLRYAAPTVTATYEYTYCYIEYLDGVCYQYETQEITTSFVPSFSYSYQCSSAVVTSYVIVFVFMYIVDLFLRPILKEKLKELRVMARAAIGMETITNDAFNSMKKLIVRMVSSTAVLLTFGVLFPPLAWMVYLSICVDFADLDRIYTQQLADRAEKGEDAGDAARILNVTRSISNLLWILFPIAAFFFSVFLFDIVGDSFGVRPGGGVGVVVFVLSLGLWLVSDWVKQRNRINTERVANFEGEDAEESARLRDAKIREFQLVDQFPDAYSRPVVAHAVNESDHVQLFTVDDAKRD